MTSLPRGVGPALLALGLAVRVWALPSWGTFDTEVQKAWSARAATGGVADIYGPDDRALLERARARDGSPLLALLSMPFPKTTFTWGSASYFVDYPPGSILVLWGAGKLWTAIDPELRNRPSGNVAINLAPVLCSAGIALMLLRSAPGGLGWVRALAFWLNPAILLGVPVLGYQDTIFGLFSLGGIMALMRGRYGTATGLMAASALVKPQGALLLPILLTVLCREASVRAWLRAALAGAVASTLVLAPWWSQGYLLSALDGCRRPLGQGTLAPLGLNVWWIAGYAMEWTQRGPWPLARIETLDAFRQWAGWDARLVARVFLLAATLANVWLLARRPREERFRIPLAAILQVHAYALLGTSVHENHTFLAVILAPLLLGVWPAAGRLTAGVSAFLFASLFLTAGFGRRITRLRTIEAVRASSGLDLSVILAVAHVVLVACIVRWAARSIPATGVSGEGEVVPA